MRPKSIVGAGPSADHGGKETRSPECQPRPGGQEIPMRTEAIRIGRDRVRRVTYGVAAGLLLAAASARAEPIDGYNCGAFSFWDVNRFGPQNLVGQHTPEGFWFDSATAGTPADHRYLLFNLNGLYTLNTMQVLNYKGGGSEDWRQMSRAPIEYSADGIAWTAIDTNHAFKLYADGWDTIRFGGVQARLVRIGSPSRGYTNNLIGSPSPGTQTGLTEVRFDGTRVKDLVAEITGVTAVASSEYLSSPNFRYAGNTVDGSGLDALDTDGDGVLGMRVGANDGWQSSISDPAPWIRWDLGEAKDLHSLIVWNFNGNGETGLGVKYARISHSLDGSTWTILGTGCLTPAWNAGNVGAGYTQYDEAFAQFFFGPARARFVRFDNLTNFNGAATGAMGLGEVKFFRKLPPRGTVVSFR